MSAFSGSVLAQTASVISSSNAEAQKFQKRVATGKSIASTADNAVIFSMSSTLSMRSRMASSLGSIASTRASAVDEAILTLDHIGKLLQQRNQLATRALNFEAPNIRSLAPLAVITEDTAVGGYPLGAKLSISSDGGQNFTFTFDRAGITWGEVANALNRQNIGVAAQFVPSITDASQNSIRFVSTNGWDFRFDPISDQTVMDDLASSMTINPAAGQTLATPANANALFGTGGSVGAGQTGLTVGYGGTVIGRNNVTLATPIAAGSSLIIKDGQGQYQVFHYAAATTLGQVITDINARGLGIRAELINSTASGTNTQLALRNACGGDLEIASSTGAFGPVGTVALAPVTGQTARAVKDVAVPYPIIGTSAPVPVVNTSFEDDPLLVGPFWQVSAPLIWQTGIAPTGWSMTGQGGLSHFPPSSAFMPSPTPDGIMNFWSNGGLLSQTLTTTLTSDRVYSLSVDVGRRTDIPFGGNRVELLAGGSVVATLPFTPPATPGTWTTNTLTFDSSTLPPTSPLFGQPLGIRLVTSGIQGNDDNIRLTEQHIENATIYAGRDYSELMILGRQYDAIGAEIAAAITNGVDTLALLSGKPLFAPAGLTTMMPLHALDFASWFGTNTFTAGRLWPIRGKPAASLAETQTMAAGRYQILEQLGIDRERLGEAMAYLRDASREFKVLADDMVAADMSADSARLRATQVRLQFATEAMAASTGQYRALLQLFG